MKCKCPNCKGEFDITNIIEPIRRETIDKFVNKIMKDLFPNQKNN